MPGKPKSINKISFSASRAKFGITRDGPKVKGPWVDKPRIVRKIVGGSKKHRQINLRSMTSAEHKTFSQTKNIALKVMKDKINSLFTFDDKFVSLAKEMRAKHKSVHLIADEIEDRLEIASRKRSLPGTVGIALKRAGYTHFEIADALKHIDISSTAIASTLHSLLFTNVQIMDAIKKSGFKEPDINRVSSFLLTLK